MGYGPQVPPEQELQMLRDNSKALKEELEQINQRISELEKQEKK
jgi:prefoldin subunit 5